MAGRKLHIIETADVLKKAGVTERREGNTRIFSNRGASNQSARIKRGDTDEARRFIASESSAGRPTTPEQRREIAEFHSSEGRRKRQAAVQKLRDIDRGTPSERRLRKVLGVVNSVDLRDFKPPAGRGVPAQQQGDMRGVGNPNDPAFKRRVQQRGDSLRRKR
jgi:hypothetical protein